MVLIFYAFAREVNPFRRRLEGHTTLGSDGLRGFRASIGGAELVLIATGMGAARARESARRALQAFPEPSLIISSGVAGALSEGLKPGDLVLADRLLLAGKEGHAAEHILPVNQARVREAERALRDAGLRFATGALLTSSLMLPDGPTKRAAKEQSGAIAVDMESAALGIEAAARGLPFVCVRAVLDGVEDELPGAGITDEQGRVRLMAATGYLARNPSAILKLPRLMLNLASATRALAGALEALCLRAQQSSAA